MRVRDVWAIAVAEGVDDGLFWELSPESTSRLMQKIRERRERETREENVRAGIIASAVANFGWRRLPRMAKWSDFFQEEPTYEDTPEGLRAALLDWAATTPGVRVS